MHTISLEGMNLADHPHVTNEILYRWLGSLCTREIAHYAPYAIFPVKVTKLPSLVLQYSASLTTGKALPCNNDKLIPGDYTACTLDGKMSTHRPFVVLIACM